MARKRKTQSSGIPDKELDALINQPAQLTMEQFQQIATTYESYGLTRRSLLESLTRSMRDLMESVEKEDAAFMFAKIADSGEDLIGKMESLLEMVRSATARLQVAVCAHPNGLAILKRAKSEDWPSEHTKSTALRLVVDNTREVTRG